MDPTSQNTNAGGTPPAPDTTPGASAAEPAAAPGAAPEAGPEATTASEAAPAPEAATTPEATPATEPAAEPTAAAPEVASEAAPETTPVTTEAAPTGPAAEAMTGTTDPTPEAMTEMPDSERKAKNNYLVIGIVIAVLALLGVGIFIAWPALSRVLPFGGATPSIPSSELMRSVCDEYGGEFTESEPQSFTEGESHTVTLYSCGIYDEDQEYEYSASTGFAISLADQDYLTIITEYTDELYKLDPETYADHKFDTFGDVVRFLTEGPYSTNEVKLETMVDEPEYYKGHLTNGSDTPSVNSNFYVVSYKNLMAEVVFDGDTAEEVMTKLGINK